MDVKGFKVELKELLNKYNAGIVFHVSEFSDTYGLSDESICVYDRDNSDVDHVLADGWCVYGDEL